MAQRAAVTMGLVQVAVSPARVVGDRNEPGGSGEVSGAGERPQITGCRPAGLRPGWGRIQAWTG